MPEANNPTESTNQKNEQNLAMKIHNTEISEPGYTKVKIRVGNLPSGNEINIFAHVFHSGKPGKTGLILAGIHGDEINGVEMLRRSIDMKLYEGLISGTVIVIPLLNIFGFINFSREVPDGKDINRSFPGNSNGSLAARVARKFTKTILPLVDFGIDFHTGGESRFNYPQVRFSPNDDRAKLLAEAFNAPFTIAKTKLPRTLRKTAFDLGKPVIVFEGGESKRLDGFAMEIGIKGIRNVLIHEKILDGTPEQVSKSVNILRSDWLRAPEAGLFVWSKRSGVFIQKGDLLGEINDVYGAKSTLVKATSEGYIIAHNNAPVVNAGDALFHIGYEI